MSNRVPVLGFEGLYEIDQLGNVYSLRTGITLKHSLAEGYPRVVLYRGRKSNSKSVHRLLAENFIPNPANLPLVNHRDGDKLNFSLDNLEWSSYVDNATHAYQNGLASPWNKGLVSDHLKRKCRWCAELFRAKKKSQVFCSNRCNAKWRVQNRPDLMERARNARGQFYPIELFKQGILTKE